MVYLEDPADLGAAAGSGGVAPVDDTASAAARQDLLTARAEQLARGSRAKATWRTYDSKWLRFGPGATSTTRTRCRRGR